MDDAQLYLLMAGQPESTPDVLHRTLQVMTRLLKQNWLKLNLTKTEVLYLGIRFVAGLLGISFSEITNEPIHHKFGFMSQFLLSLGRM